MDKFECSRVKSIFRAYFSHNSFCDLYSLLCLNRPWISFYSIGNNCVPYCQGCTPFTCLLPTPALPNMLVLDSNYRHTCGHTRQWPFFFLPILHHSTCGSRLFLSLGGPPHSIPQIASCRGLHPQEKNLCLPSQPQKHRCLFAAGTHAVHTRPVSCPSPVDAGVLPFTCGC